MKLADEFEAVAKAKRTATQARRVISRLHAEITGEVLPNSTVTAFVKNWLHEKENTAPTTQAFYRASTAKFLEHLGAAAEGELSSITKTHVLGFRNDQLARLASRTANHHLKVIKMLFRAAKRDGYLVDDPSEFVETVKAKRHQQKSRRPFTLDEIRAVLSVADDEWRSMIICGLYTGQRLGDVARLTWANVDLDREQVRLVAQKTGAPLTIPMAAPLRSHLESLPAPDKRPDDASLHPRAAASLERTVKSGSLSNQFSDLLALAGLRKKAAHRVTTGKGRDASGTAQALSFHCLRHTAVSLL